MDTISQKRCTKCGEIKPINQFYKDKSSKDGKTGWCKDCYRISLNKWRSEHKDQVRAQCKRWAVKHHDHVIQKAYKWAKANPEKHRFWIDVWHKNHPEKSHEIAKKYRTKHPDKQREKTRNRRARIKGCQGSFTEKDWQEILQKYGDKCLNPNCPDPSRPVTRDHVVPISLGGVNSKENIQPLCKPCNSWKSDRIIDFRPF